MNAVFLDSVGLLAIWNTADQWHEAAEKAFVKIADRRRPFLATTFVMLECGNAAARRPFRQKVCELRQNLEEGNSLITPTEADWASAWEEYARGKAGNAGIVDHVSFIVMRRLGITDAFTNDRHFKAAGFTTLF